MTSLGGRVPEEEGGAGEVLSVASMPLTGTASILLPEAATFQGGLRAGASPLQSSFCVSLIPIPAQLASVAHSLLLHLFSTWLTILPGLHRCQKAQLHINPVLSHRSECISRPRPRTPQHSSGIQFITVPTLYKTPGKLGWADRGTKDPRGVFCLVNLASFDQLNAEVVFG